MTSAASHSTPSGFLARRLQALRVWWTMLVICLEERLVYRGDFVLGTLMRFLPIVTQVFLWTAVFGATSSGSIAGYSRNDIVAYYLLTMVSRAFSSMPGLASGIARSTWRWALATGVLVGLLMGAGLVLAQNGIVHALRAVLGEGPAAETVPVHAPAPGTAAGRPA